MFKAGSVTSAGDVLAMNFLMDRDAQHWAADFTALKTEVGACNTTSAIAPSGLLSGAFTWTCEYGRVQGELLLAPTPAPRIQSLSMMRAAP